ncbi:hypothetical protein HY844_01570 [Candidatus Berkelbacteria bacterium]|nr:hypothetical protein [Candidatus Berkelbacteria bacterium]
MKKKYSGEERFVLNSINQMFGELNSGYLSLQNPNIEIQQTGAIEASAGWQASAIAALTRFSNLKISPIDDRRLLDFFYYFVDKSTRKLDSNPITAKETVGKLVSGVFGATAATKFLTNNGYRAWLPETDDDVKHKVDLIFSKSGDTSGKTNYKLAQIKSVRSSEDGIEIYDDPSHLGRLDTKETLDWEKLTRFSAAVDSTFGGESLDFSPVWVKISHVGLSEPDDWREAIDFIGSCELDQQGGEDGS